MYSPKISEELVIELYQIAKQKKIHMTTLVNNILSKAISISFSIKDRKRYKQLRRSKSMATEY